MLVSPALSKPANPAIVIFANFAVAYLYPYLDFKTASTIATSLLSTPNLTIITQYTADFQILTQTGFNKSRTLSCSCCY